ncbi:MAG: PIN domain nuclease [Chlamydiota bacterium]
MVIVDTTVWVDYLRGVENSETDWLNLELGRQRLGLTDLILCEVLQGIRDPAAFSRVLRELRKFEVFETGGVELAVAAAENFRKLRERGRTVRKTIDCLIATFCLRGRHSLLHRDRDFDPFEQMLGLPVIHPHRPGQGAEPSLVKQ